MTIEQRHDRDLGPPQDTHDARWRELKERLTRPITVGEFRKFEGPPRSERLRKAILGDDEPSDFLTELRKRREAREAGETNE